MKTQVELKNGEKATIRDITVDDIDRSHDFFSALPEEDRAYLRVDVTQKDVVERRIRDIHPDRIIRLVALHDDQIIADGSLESEGTGWKEHIAEMRLIVARPYQRMGLGMLLARELYLLAAKRQVEEIVIRFMGAQEAARTIFTNLGFHLDAILHHYVKDLYGKPQDLIIMRCNLEELWMELEAHIKANDWQRTR
jgi:ribosomal protein S18 acetylase RimI-like enzyme